MGKHKIGFIINSLSSGGAERVLSTLANNFVDTYDVTIITFIATPPFYGLDQRIKVIPCFERIKPSSNFIVAIQSNYILFKKINKIVKESNFDILIGFMTTANVLATITGKLNGIPIIISERNNPNLDKAPKMWQFLRHFCYPLANYVVVQTKTIKEFYIKKIREERLTILPNPIAATLTSKRSNKIVKENIILNVGRLTPQKGQDMLIKAFSRTTNNNNWKLVIAGEGPNRADYEKLIEKLNLEQNVELLGNYSEIHDLYNKSKIFAFSSIYEGFPNALIEAMHYGLASISTDCPTGPSELINDGENGYLTPLNNEQEMANKLQILMNDEKKRRMFGKTAISSVEKFEIKNVAGQWKKMIDACLLKDRTSQIKVKK